MHVLPNHLIGEGGSITAMVQGLLSRCISESVPENRIALATCLGELGALDPNRIGRDVRMTQNTHFSNKDNDKWRLHENAPWKFKSVEVHYKLQLVTKHFVIALKAAPTPTDQHKIAFAIQEGEPD